MIKVAEPFHKSIERLLPARWKNSLDEYSSGAQTISTTSDWKLVLRSYTINLVVYSVIMIAIVLLSTRYLYPLVTEHLISGIWGDITAVAITLIFMAPFLWALAVHHPQKEAQGRIWANKNYRSLIIVLEFIRIGIAILFIGFLLNQVFSVLVTIVVGLFIVGLLVVFSKRIQNFYIRIEDRFMSNLNAREISAASKMTHTLVPWEAHLTSFDVSPESAVVGKSLVELQIRETYGVNVAVIERGDRTIMAPTRYERIFPDDKIYIFGTDEQLEAFRKLIESEAVPELNGEAGKEEIRLQKLVVSAESMLLNKTVRASGVREKTKGLIVGIEKRGERILNPDSELVIEEGDILWIVGSPWRVRQLEAAKELVV
jgi:CPA2 family monovalent cation:H+ antiporter-2